MVREALDNGLHDDFVFGVGAKWLSLVQSLGGARQLQSFNASSPANGAAAARLSPFSISAQLKTSQPAIRSSAYAMPISRRDNNPADLHDRRHSRTRIRGTLACRVNGRKAWCGENEGRRSGGSANAQTNFILSISQQTALGTVKAQTGAEQATASRKQIPSSGPHIQFQRTSSQYSGKSESRPSAPRTSKARPHGRPTPVCHFPNFRTNRSPRLCRA